VEASYSSSEDSIYPTVVMFWLILLVMCLSVTLLYCGWTCKWIKMVFGMRITTKDSHFLVDGGQDLHTWKKISPRGTIGCWTWRIFGWLIFMLLLLIFSIKSQVCFSAAVGRTSSCWALVLCISKVVLLFAVVYYFTCIVPDWGQCFDNVGRVTAFNEICTSYLQLFSFIMNITISMYMDQLNW